MSNNPVVYMIALFKSVHHVLAAEKILKKEGIPHKLIPVPKAISSDCGVCLRFLQEYKKDIECLLPGSQGLLDIQTLN